MSETRINENVVKKVSETGDIKFWKKVKYNMNCYYTEISENIYEQLGVKYATIEKCHRGNDMYLVSEDIQKDKDLYLGNSISSRTQLSLIKKDLNEFLATKRNRSRKYRRSMERFFKNDCSRYIHFKSR